MADYFTHLAFAIPASDADAERFIKLMDATIALEETGDTVLAPEIERAFGATPETAKDKLAEIFSDNADIGIDCVFNETQQILTIFDRAGEPALWPLAECLQRLFPEKLPLGFTYANTCSKRRTDGFGGGIFAIGTECVVHKSLDQVLAEELEDLARPTDAT